MTTLGQLKEQLAITLQEGVTWFDSLTPPEQHLLATFIDQCMKRDELVAQIQVRNEIQQRLDNYNKGDK